MAGAAAAAAASSSKSQRRQRRRDSQLVAYPSMGFVPDSNAGRRSSRVNRVVLSFLVAFSFLFLILFLVYPTRRSVPVPPPNFKFYSFEIVHEFPHDPDAFTQGLLYGGNDTLYESTGLYQRSSLRKVLLHTGKILEYHEMDGSLFGEGLTLFDGRLFQLTWLTNTGIVYDCHNFSRQQGYSHPMRDGWGLATDGKVLFGSDGTAVLYHLDPLTFKDIKKVTVTYEDHTISSLNELEYIGGEVWANIWMTDCIARISKEDGRVLSWILLHGLRQRLLRSGYRNIDVLNGIAWDEEKKRLFVTGKLWPKLYEIKLRPIFGPVNGRIEDLCPIIH